MIEITQVSNGYIVRCNISAKDSTRVFQTMAELIQYISEHFTYRQHEVLVDGPF